MRRKRRPRLRRRQGCTIPLTPEAISAFEEQREAFRRKFRRDPCPGDACVLYWFELRRNGGSVQWIHHLIDSDSGVGTQFEVGDVNDDSLPDVVEAKERRARFFFLQESDGHQ